MEMYLMMHDTELWRKEKFVFEVFARIVTLMESPHPALSLARYE